MTAKKLFNYAFCRKCGFREVCDSLEDYETLRAKHDRVHDAWAHPWRVIFARGMKADGA